MRAGSNRNLVLDSLHLDFLVFLYRMILLGLAIAMVWRKIGMEVSGHSGYELDWTRMLLVMAHSICTAIKPAARRRDGGRDPGDTGRRLDRH